MPKYTEWAVKKAAAINNANALMTDEEALAHRDALLPWRAGCEYIEGDRFTYKGKFYKVLQKHTSQAEWLPADAPSLYVRISDPAVEWPEWAQPTGAHDAYAKGAKVAHNEKRWVSEVDANVWEPGAYGWTEHFTEEK